MYDVVGQALQGDVWKEILIMMIDKSLQNNSQLRWWNPRRALT
jgi:hypothetical protein